VYPGYGAATDWSLVALGAGTLAASFLPGTGHAPVPSEGRDPAEIRWSFDRNRVGNRDESADTASNWTRNVSLAFPLAIAFAASPDGERLAGIRRRAGMYAEAFLLGQGVVRLGKTEIARPRPYTYLAEADRPTSAPYDVTNARAFRGMPSGHAATAWTAVGLGIAEDLLARPHASARERMSIGALGGALAAATSVLRVKAGQHFPSDVIAGGALGLAIGVTLPLLHRGDAPSPSGRAWLEAAGGAVVGGLAGGLVAGSF
jgi:membrane-associated phospholipid phosphatase